MADRKKHPIRIVARRTGTPETTLRAWERRYGAVRPERAETGRRLYSDGDVLRLTLIRQAVDAGRSVSKVAGLSDDELHRLVEEDRQAAMAETTTLRATHSAEDVVDACLSSVESMDSRSLSSHLNRAALKFPVLALIEEIMTPFLDRIGDHWRERRLGARHEHMASTVVRTILVQLQSGIQHDGARTLVVGTPPGQVHDLGTEFVSALAVSEGWNPVNLGANVPAPDVVATVHELRAAVVALSLVHPPGDSRVEDALTYLGEHLGDGVQLVVGGRGAAGYESSVVKAGGTVVESLRGLADLLSA